MVHHKKGKKLGRKIGPRKALARSLILSLILHNKIKTTFAKAKFIQPKVERIIVLAKKKTLASRRLTHDLIINEKAEKRVIKELVPKYKDKKSGFTRILRLGKRKGDAAEMVQIELV